MPADKHTLTFNLSALTKSTLKWLNEYSDHINLNANTDIQTSLSPVDCVLADKSKKGIIAKRKLTNYLNALVEALVVGSIAEFNYSLTTFQKEEWLNLLLSKFELDKSFYKEAKAEDDVDYTTVMKDYILDIIDELLLEYIDSIGLIFNNYPNRIVTVKIVKGLAIVTLGEDFRIAAYKKSNKSTRWDGEEWEC